MKFKITVVLTVVLELISLELSSQNFVDIANINYTHGSSKNPNRIVINLKAPVVLKNKDILLLSGEYHELTMPLKNYNPLQGGNLVAGYQKNIGEGNSIFLAAINRFQQEKGGNLMDAYQLGGIVIATIQKSERFKYKFGAYYNQELFGTFMVPLFGFDWKPNKQWNFYGTLPISANIAYSPTEKFVTGISFKGTVATYTMNTNKHLYTHRVTNEAFAFADFYLTPSLVFQCKAGHTFGRNFKTFSTNDKMNLAISSVKVGDNRPIQEEYKTDSWLLQGALIYRYSLTKK